MEANPKVQIKDLYFGQSTGEKKCNNRYDYSIQMAFMNWSQELSAIRWVHITNESSWSIQAKA